MWFAKTYGLEEWSENDLLPLVRFFLLGYFGKSRIEPEHTVQQPLAPKGKGRVDFLLGKVAVEFAVRKYSDYSTKIKPHDNRFEIRKLLKYEGPAALVLFDFSDEPFPDDLDVYRELPVVGRGHRRNPFSVLYYYRDEDGRPDVVRKNIKLRQ